MRYLLLLGTVALVGCQGEGGNTYVGRPGSPAWNITATQETKMAYYRKQCEAYGFKAGTTQIAQCMQQEAIATRQDGRARSSAAMAAAAASQPRQPVHCTTTTWGTVTCM
jgi:hypothetical protein